MPCVQSRPNGADRDDSRAPSGGAIAEARFVMKNRGATGRYFETAFLQAEGELCLSPRCQPKTAAPMPTRSQPQSVGEDPESPSRLPIHGARRASGSPATIQSP